MIKIMRACTFIKFEEDLLFSLGVQDILDVLEDNADLDEFDLEKNFWELLMDGTNEKYFKK